MEHSREERIAVLETKVDDLRESIKELRAFLEPMMALYQAGKVVMWIGGIILSYSHWDQVVALYHQLINTSKH